MPGLSVSAVDVAAVVMEGVIAVTVQSIAMAWDSFFKVGMMWVSVSVKEQSILYDSASVGLSQNVTAKNVTVLRLFVRLLSAFQT